MKLYWTYRPERISNPLSLGNGVSLNGTYTVWFFLKNQFADYEAAGLTKILDSEIPESNYVSMVAPGVPKLTRFIVGEYNETYVDGAEFAKSVAAVGARFQIEIFATAQEAIDWVRSNCNLTEESPGKFLIHPAYSDPVMGESLAKYLEIA